MDFKIATSVSVIKNLLESNHPEATVKGANSESCDFRVRSIGESITVKEYGGSVVTDEDIKEIKKQGTIEMSGCRLDFVRKNGDTVWFELHY